MRVAFINSLYAPYAASCAEATLQRLRRGTAAVARAIAPVEADAGVSAAARTEARRA